MKLGIIASVRHPIEEPFAGGLEMHTYALATSLRARGHDVTLFASRVPNSDLGVEPICEEAHQIDYSAAARQDVSMLAASETVWRASCTGSGS